MYLGSGITELKKAKGWSQSQLTKFITDALDVSLDYLVGNAEQKIDKITLGRIQEINKLTGANKNLVYTFLGAFITKSKLQSVL